MTDKENNKKKLFSNPLENLIDDRQRKLIYRRTTMFVLFGAIILVFVLWGMRMPSMGLHGGGAVAVVGGNVIPVMEWKEEVERLEQMYAPYMGGEVNEMMRQRIRAQAVEMLIGREIVAQGAVNEGIRVTDLEVRDTILEMPYFKRDGAFDPKLYDQALQYQGQSPADFEGRVRKQSVLMRTQKMFERGVGALNYEIEKEKELSGKKINLAFAKIDLQKGDLNIPQARLQKALTDAEFKQKIEKYYNEHPAEFTEQEQVQAQHILIKADPQNKESESKALKKIKEIKERAEKGEDFAQLAKTYSEDPGSNNKGGDLGFFSRGRMVPAFEEVAFKLDIGKFSDPVKTDFGYHLIRVVAKSPQKLKSLVDSQESIAKKLIREEEVQVAIKEIEDLLAQGKSDKLTSVLDKVGVKWEDTGLFELSAESIPKVGANEEFFIEALKLKKEGEVVSHLIKQGSIRYLVKLKEIKDETSQQKPEDVKVKLASDRGGFVLSEWADQYRKQVKVERKVQLNQ